MFHASLIRTLVIGFRFYLGNPGKSQILNYTFKYYPPPNQVMPQVPGYGHIFWLFNPLQESRMIPKLLGLATKRMKFA